MAADTLLYFVSHASLLIRYQDRFVLTDPWFLSPAFCSWAPCPPVTLNPDILVALAHSGKLVVVISHGHGDHADSMFLKKLPNRTPIVVPRFPNRYLTKQLIGQGCQNIIEIDETGLDYDGIQYNVFPSHLNQIDAAISLSLDDLFLFHGNDCWRLDEHQKNRLNSFKPRSICSIFAGQGSSASGHPLAYDGYENPVEELELKNRKMYAAVGELAKELKFTWALPYACFTRVSVPGRNYEHPTLPPTAKLCSSSTGLDNYLDLQPGDLFLPKQNRLIKMLSTLEIDQNIYSTIETSVPRLDSSECDWTGSDENRISHLVSYWQQYLKQRASESSVAHRIEQDIHFSISIIGHDNKRLYKNTLSGKLSSKHSLELKISTAVLRGLSNGSVNFEDLDTGYLARSARDPLEWFDQDLYNMISDFGYFYRSIVKNDLKE